MKTNYPPIDPIQNSFSLILNNDRPIENLITSFVTRPRSTLVFGPTEDDKKSKSLVMLVDDNKNVLNYSEFDIAALRKRYKKVNAYFEPIVIADTGAARLPFEELQEHREKNGTKWNEASGIFEINASFLGNLCMSYIIDNRAGIKITLDFLENQNHYPRYYYLIEIFHLGELPGIEKYAVLKDKLVRYVG